MSENITVTIGGAPIQVPAILTFNRLKLCQPAYKELSHSVDLIDVTAIAARVISVALMDTRPELSPEEIELRLVPSEMTGLRNAMFKLLVDCGIFVSKEAPDKTQSAA